MKWYPAEVLKEDQTTDELNNMVPAGTYTHLKCTQARLSPWTVEEVAALGRDVTETTLRFIFPFPFELFPGTATHVRVELEDGEHLLKIESRKGRFSRFTTITAKEYRT